MERKTVTLKQIDHDHRITRETDSDFLYTLESALLLALKERGQLNEMQYRHAGQQLKIQRREYARKNREEKGGTE